MLPIRLVHFGILGVCLSGCIPPRPKVDFCDVDKLPLQAAAKSILDSQTASERELAWNSFVFAPVCHCSDGAGRKWDLTLDQCDKFVALSSSDEKAAMDYVVELERQILEDEKP